MSFDKPSGSGDRDHGSDRPHERKPPPGGWGDRPDPTPLPAHAPTADEVRARRARYKSSIEYSDAMAAKQSEAAKDKKPDESGEPTDKAKLNENAVLRQNVADLKVDNARLVAENKALKAENAGIQTEISDLKAANIERDWRDKARDAQDEIRDRKIEELSAKVDELGGGRRNEGIDSRTGGGEAEDALRETKQSKRRRVPTDAVGIGSILASGGVSDLAYHLKVLPPEAATIAGTVLSAGTAGWTWWRKHKDGKAGKDADR